MKRSRLDMTTGAPLPLLVKFAFPQMLGAFLQQMYSFADTAIVGRCISVDALSAVGVTGSLTMVILGFIMGTAGGFTILMSQSVGAQKQEDISRCFWNGLYTCLAIAAAITLCITPIVRPLLQWMRTPQQLLDMAVEYLRIIVLGTLPMVLYNYLGGVLRAFGDSQRPFYFLLFASMLNMVLDLVLILVFRMGVAAAAIATVASQAVSAVLCAWWLFFRMQGIQGGGFRKPSLRFIRKLLGLGLPLGLESCVTSLGFLFLQGSINTLGAAAAAAQVCGEKIRHIATIPCDSLSIAMSTYVGQNYGARRIDRIKAGIRGGMAIQFAVCIGTWAILLVLSEPLVALLLGQSQSPEALGAVQYLRIISSLFLLQGAMKVCRSVIQGMGFSLVAFGSGVMEILGRCLGGMLAVSFGSFTWICLSNPLAWGIAMVYCVIAAFLLLRRKELEFASVKK